MYAQNTGKFMNALNGNAIRVHIAELLNRG